MKIITGLVSVGGFMNGVQPRSFAVMHLSSELAVLYMVEFTALDNIRVLEEARREITFGAEVFQNGYISFETVRDVCELLQGFKKIMAEYGCLEYRLVATTAMREAQNQVYIADQIRIKTGLELEVLDIPVEHCYIYSALFREALENKFIFKDTRTVAERQTKNILFSDVSSGGMSVALYASDELRYLQNINISAMRIKESFTRDQREDIDFPQALEELVAASVENIVRDLRGALIHTVVFSGAEVPLLLKLLRHQLRSGFIVIDRLEFLELYKNIRFLSAVQLTKKFNLVEDEAEYVLPMMTIYRDILKMTAANEIVVTKTGFIQGLAIEAVSLRTKNSWLELQERQIYSLARAFGKKHGYDAQHADFVEKFALQIFDAMATVHGMGSRERFMLKIACVLHDAGKHTGLRCHYRNSYNIIRSYDLPGFSDVERLVIANVAYFHSTYVPEIDSSEFARIDAANRMRISKLAAIIRVADALDRSHLQKISALKVAVDGEELRLKVKCRMKIALEEWMLEEKAEFFEEVYGLIPILDKEE